MKKLYVALAGILFSSALFSQTQRYQLFEEFTGENCPPCAATNPALNQLLDENEEFVIAIKYQSPIPSAGPLYNQNTVDVQNRLSYYAVNSAPSGRQDGKSFRSNNQTHPANFSQTDINLGKVITSPVSISTTHRLSSALDSIYVDVLVTAVEPVSGNVKLRIAVVEHEIVFDKAPGTNGEKKFEDVMKKMLPSAGGTTVPSLAVGETFTVSYSWKLANVYDLNELAVVSFLQDDNSKSVLQAGYSQPQGLAYDLATKSVDLPLFQCETELAPKITLYNPGANAITSATIKYKIGTSAEQTFTWNGNIPSKGSEQIEAPVVSMVNGSNTATFTILEINGSSDPNSGNNVKIGTTNILAVAKDAPYIETFQLAAFPSNGFFINNPGKNDTWIQGTGYGGFKVGASQRATKIIMYFADPGEIDELYLPKVDLTKLDGKGWITYDVAHAGVESGPVTDKLEVYVSNDCGETWALVDSKENDDLVTAASTTNYFNPTATQWKQYNADISDYLTYDNAIFKFVATAGTNGNNLWLDNINVNQSVGLEENQFGTELSIFPNPASHETNISLNLSSNSDVTVVVYDALGKAVFQKDFTNMGNGNHELPLNVSELRNGIYSVTVTSGEETFSRSLRVAH